MSDKQPIVSVVMPVYNGEKYVAEAINSVLNQTYNRFEFIIVDDASTDKTANIIKSFDDNRIVYVRNEKNQKVAKSLNRGLSLATGKYIMRMDADDICDSKRMARQIKYLNNHSDIAVLGCGMKMFGVGFISKEMILADNPEQTKIDSLFFCPVAHPSVMFRRELFSEGYSYDPDYEGVEDYHLWIRIMQKYNVCSLQEVLVNYRIHDNQVTQKYNYETIEKIKRIRQIQLNEMEIDYTEEQLNAYVKAWTGQLELNDIEMLISLLKQFYQKNKLCQKYHINLLRLHFYAFIKNKTADINAPYLSKVRVLIKAAKCFETSGLKLCMDIFRLNRC